MSAKRKKVVIFLILVAVLLGMTICAPVIAPYDPDAQDLSAALEAPSFLHPFGTDRFGRDMLSRVLVGGRATIGLSLLLVAIVTAAGTALGVIAGYAGGAADAVIMRITDVFLAFPGIVLAIAVAGVLGGGSVNAVLSLALTSWPKFARLARSSTLRIRQENYIGAARLSGCSTPKIICYHILPNIAGSVIVMAVLDIGTMIMEIAGLSFLQLGVQPPTAEWGSMMSGGRSMLQTCPWTVLAPGFAIFLTVCLFNLLGESLRNLLDPGEVRTEKKENRRRNVKICRTAVDEKRRSAKGKIPEEKKESPDTLLCGTREQTKAGKSGFCRGKAEDPVLSFRDITIGYGSKEVVHGVSLSVFPGEIVGIAGESGSGKTTLIGSVLGLHPAAHVDDGSIVVFGSDISGISLEERRNLSGERIGMIFQNASSFLTPVRTIEGQTLEMLKDHRKEGKDRGKDWYGDRKEAEKRALSLLEKLKISDPERVWKSYPGELSGGMCQRAAIMMAMLPEPALILADEPASALDTLSGREVADLLLELCHERHMAALVITHSIALAEHMCDRVAIMHEGCIVECGRTNEVLQNPSEDYTKKLVESTFRLRR